MKELDYLQLCSKMNFSLLSLAYFLLLERPGAREKNKKQM